MVGPSINATTTPTIDWRADMRERRLNVQRSCGQDPLRVARILSWVIFLFWLGLFVFELCFTWMRYTYTFNDLPKRAFAGHPAQYWIYFNFTLNASFMFLGVAPSSGGNPYSHACCGLSRIFLLTFSFWWSAVGTLQYLIGVPIVWGIWVAPHHETDFIVRECATVAFGGSIAAMMLVVRRCFLAHWEEVLAAERDMNNGEQEV